MFCRPRPLFDTLMQHRQYPKSELECYYTASAYCLFHNWDLCSYHWCYVVVPHGWPSDLLYRCNLESSWISESCVYFNLAITTFSDCFISWFYAYMFGHPSPSFDILMEHRKFRISEYELLIFCQNTDFFRYLRLVFITLVLCGGSPKADTQICFTAATWNPHDFPRPIFTSILQKGHFPNSDI